METISPRHADLPGRRTAFPLCTAGPFPLMIRQELAACNVTLAQPRRRTAPPRGVSRASAPPAPVPSSWAGTAPFRPCAARGAYRCRKAPPAPRQTRLQTTLGPVAMPAAGLPLARIRCIGSACLQACPSSLLLPPRATLGRPTLGTCLQAWPSSLLLLYSPSPLPASCE